MLFDAVIIKWIVYVYVCWWHLNNRLHYTTLHYTTLHYTTLRYSTLRYATLRYATLRYAENTHAEITVNIVVKWVMWNFWIAHFVTTVTCD